MLNDSDHDGYELYASPSNGQFSQAAFQMPQFMYNGPPTLAPGGGAEVLPLGGQSVWMENSGFSFAGARTMSYNTPDSTYRSSLQQALDYGDSPTTVTAPFDYDSMPVSSPVQAPLTTSFFAPSPLGLPVYSTSGFDLLSVFGRVANRPNPQIKLGPVDLTSSFVVVDVRRYDHPIVYCSPTFCTLTGYEEREILGKNCRFLQAPPTVGVLKGDERKWTSADAVKLLRKSLVAGKEVQASLVNYKKDGSAFINLVTVIPVPEVGGSGEPLYHLGFQVDLTQQPAAILDRLKAGSYITSGPTSDLHVIPKKPPPIPPIVASESLILPPTSEDSHPLSMAILAASPDFFLVVSLKGLLLYVAPAVSHVLGYAPSDLVNKSLGDIAHTADVIPLMRELKDSSAPGEKPRPVDLLFRARKMGGGWVWLECRGRLHVEPGKGRKAIVLSARVKEVGSLRAPLVSGGVSGTVTPDGTILVATRDVAGWTVAELVGKSFYALFDTLTVLPDAKRALMRRKEGGKVEVEVRVWKQLGSDSLPRVYQITDAPSQSQVPSFDVFEELGTERESSWQYELQQLRFKNQRLEEQIKGIEREARAIPTSRHHVQSQQDVYGDAVAAPWYGQSLKRSWDGIS